ncbi:MAG: hypothetical protein RR068_12480 [Hafnia sp.]
MATSPDRSANNTTQATFTYMIDDKQSYSYKNETGAGTAGIANLIGIANALDIGAGSLITF